MNILEKHHCILCGSTDSKPLFISWDMWHDYEKNYKKKFNFVQCKQCNLVYLNPRVPEKDIHLYYPDNYISHGPDNRTKTDSLQNNFLNKPIIKTYLSPYLQRIIQTCLRIRYEKIKNSPPQMSIIKRIFISLFEQTLIAKTNSLGFNGEGLKLLDIGCGVGNLLKRQQTLNWEVYGFEPSSNAVQVCRNQGLNVIQGVFDPSKWDMSFDVVMMNQVIEHLPNPMFVLNQIHNVLKPGGIIYITTPNFSSVPARIFKTYWIGSADTPRHYCLYTPRTIKRMLKQTDYACNLWYTQSSTHGFTAAFEFILRERFKLNIKKDYIRKNRILSLITMPFVRVLDLLNIGDNLHVFAQKSK